MIGEQIAFYRKRKRMTQEQLGEALGVTNRTVSKWEAGVSSPGIDLVPALASALGISLDSLFGIEGKEEPNELSALIRDAVFAAVREILPPAVENALQESLPDHLSAPENADDYSLSVLSRNKATACQFYGRGMVRGPFYDHPKAPDLWHISVWVPGGWIEMGDYTSKSEASQDLAKLFEAYTNKEAVITL
ncbi:MAG: helix-turn-helix transcriptional regulator [Oscillospiraceae bacterium]|nr:helix-turn-helix transcriptional regulator [Oscillospiraceae bacterium]